MSMMLALRLAALALPPPTCRMRPGANMTEVAVPPALSVGNNVGKIVIEPFPAGLTRYMVLLARPKTSPSGPMKFFG
jgi:hypothetical protein